MTHPPRSLGDVVASLTANTEPYLSCDECFDRICAYVEHVVADPQYEDVAMQTHLHACGVCAEEAATLIELTAMDDEAKRGSPLPALD
jgi:hypothetical protein